MSNYSYDRTARYEGSAEQVFKQMKESVDSLIEARVKIRKLHEWLGELARDATGSAPFKDVYDDKDVKAVDKELYALDHTIGEAFRNIERLERDLKKKVK